ncbi:MAG: hypothetical protein JJU11_16160 [Candidatus Sumerlaeia bacterium]|nr:hypothetical protein [Candidatus Sumerlaeia bacterium]
MGIPGGHGYFFHQHTLEHLVIMEHASHVREHPEDFGLRESEVSNLAWNHERIELLDLVFHRGWVRVRFYRGDCTLEYRGGWKATRNFVPHVADVVGFGDKTRVNLFNHELMAGLEGWYWEELEPLLADETATLSNHARPIVILRKDIE